MKIHYAIVKHYQAKLFSGRVWKGQFVPLILTPVTNSKALYLLVAGEAVDKEDSFFCPLIKEMIVANMEKQIQSEIDYNYKAKTTEFILVESLECNTVQKKDSYFITLKEKGKNFKSNIEIFLDENKSTELGRRVYRINGKLNIYALETNDRTAQMVMRKSMATYKSLMNLRGK